MLSLLNSYFPPKEVVLYKNGLVQFHSQSFFERFYRRYFCKEESREHLAHVYESFVRSFVELGIDRDEASIKVSYAWDKAYGKSQVYSVEDNPEVIQNSAFVKFFVQGRVLSRDFYERVSNELSMTSKPMKGIPIQIHFNEQNYNDVGPGVTFLGSLSKTRRLYLDNLAGGPLDKIREDLEKSAQINDLKMRKVNVLATLSGAAYRDINTKILKIPSLADEKSTRLIECQCKIERIWKGILAFRVEPTKEEDRRKERSLFIFQGTTPYPSQEGWMAKMLAGVHADGVGRGAFLEDKQKIKAILHSVTENSFGKKPIIGGHSLGAALARHTWYAFPKDIEQAYLYSAPGIEAKTVSDEEKLSKESLEKGVTYCNIDDPVCWGIGTHIGRNTKLVIGVNRWKVRSHNVLDLLVLPWLYRILSNYKARMVSHKKMFVLQKTHLVIPIQRSKENPLRNRRPDFKMFQSFRPRAERAFTAWHDYWEHKEVERLRGV